MAHGERDDRSVSVGMDSERGQDREGKGQSLEDL